MRTWLANAWIIACTAALSDLARASDVLCFKDGRIFDVPNARWVMRTIATRGERLTLSQILLQGDVAGGGGALEIDHRGDAHQGEVTVAAGHLVEPEQMGAMDERPFTWVDGEGAAGGDGLDGDPVDLLQDALEQQGDDLDRRPLDQPRQPLADD